MTKIWNAFIKNIIKPVQRQNATGQIPNSIPTEDLSDLLETKVMHNNYNLSTIFVFYFESLKFSIISFNTFYKKVLFLIRSSIKLFF